MSTAFQIGDRWIGAQHHPFVIAEMSGNHNQSLDRALAIVDAAAACGAHALKLQTYTAETITLNAPGGDFEITDPNSLWNGKNLHDLYQQACTPWEWHAPIMQRAKELGIICFSSPFDETAIDFLEKLNVPAYKIASFENNHLPLIARAASTGKPLIISTGMASVGELELAVKTAKGSGCNDIVLLKCTSSYPASPESANIRTIPHLGELFGCEVGLSDHTMGIGVAIAAIATGASVIEKHLTLSRKEGGVDSAFSLEPHEMASLVTEVGRAWLSLGKVSYGATESEVNSLRLRRSIYASAQIAKGELFTSDNIRIVRPGLGANPKYYDLLLGMASEKGYAFGEPIQFGAGI